MTSILKADNIQDADGNNIINESSNTITIGASGDTISIPSGATFNINGTAGTGIGTNTPAFAAKMSGTQTLSNDTATKLNFNTEVFDTAGAYDHSSNYRFTPQTAGKYFCTLNIYFDGGGQGNLRIFNAQIYFNGSLAYIVGNDTATGYENNGRLSLSAIITFNGSSDYIEPYFYGYTQNASNLTLGGSPTYDALFSAYKIIE